MKKEPKGAKNRIVIAKDEKNVLTCTSEGFVVVNPSRTVG